MQNDADHNSMPLSTAVHGWTTDRALPSTPCIGVLRGEGVGAEVISVTEKVLRRLDETEQIGFEWLEGGAIGNDSVRECGAALTPGVVDFCHQVFSRSGAVLCGPGGARFVYELRAALDLFCKLTPVQPFAELDGAGVLRSSARENVDIVVVRENIGGLYFSKSEFGSTSNGCAQLKQHFHYDEPTVRRIAEVAGRLAARRRGRLTVVTKPGGMPDFSRLWKHTVESVAQDLGIDSVEELEVDNAVYQIPARAADFDVVVAPNLFGDIVSDGAALLLGSRGLSYSFNLGAPGVAVYQTGHGAALDLAGKDRANPIGQLLTACAMLRNSFAMPEHADRIEVAIRRVLAAKWRTADIAEPDSKVIGTQEIGERIAHEVTRVPKGVTPGGA